MALVALVWTACSGSGSGSTTRTLISDDFANNNNRWPVDNVHSFFEPGRYRIKSFDDRAFLTTQGGSAADLTIEVELQRLDGPTDIFYGVYLRASPSPGYYIFWINDEGQFRFGRFRSAATAVDPMSAGATLVNHGEKNTLRVSARGKTFRLELNGSPLVDIEENFQFSNTGRYGIIVGPKLEVAVTKFVVTAP